MKIGSPESKTDVDRFLECREASITQSGKWGDVKKQNQRVERLQAKKGGEIVGVCQFLEEQNPFGDYFYIPYGPVSPYSEVRKKIVEEITGIAKRENKFMVKMEPKERCELGITTPHRIQPRKTLILDISKPEQELLNSFDSGTRYDIRYAERKGVKVKRVGEVDDFFGLLQKTTDRQNFNTFSKGYFKNLLRFLDCDLFIAYHDSNPIAATIFGYFGKVATSLHSAFDYEKRKLRAPAFLRFEAIKRAMKRGTDKFDAWGIDEEKMPGVTRFKKGFGGKEVVYPEARDIPIKPITYKSYNLAAKIIK